MFDWLFSYLLVLHSTSRDLPVVFGLELKSDNAFVIFGSNGEIV